MNFNVTIEGNVTISLTPDADGIQLDIWAEVPDNESQGAETPENPDQGTKTSEDSRSRQDSLKMAGSGAGGTRLYNHSTKASKGASENSEFAEAESEAPDNPAADSCKVKFHTVDEEFMKEMEEILQGMKMSRNDIEDSGLQKNSCAGLQEDEPDDDGSDDDFPDDPEDDDYDDENDDYDDEDDGLLDDWDLDDFLEEKTLEELMELWYGLRSVGITVESPGFFEEEDDCDKDKVVMVLTPGEEPRVVTYGEADMLMPDFCVDYDCIENFMGNKLNLYHREGDVIRLGGEKFLTGPAVVCFEGRDGSLWSLTGKEVHQVFRYYQVNKAALALKPHCPDAKRTKAIQLWK